jgi:glycerol-3-phosphate dehydrogenase (NAD(P)+)
MRIAVLGAGAWGTAIAAVASARHEVLLWARDPAQAAQMVRERVNSRYLPGVGLAQPLAITGELPAALAHAAAGLAIVATPMAALRETLLGLPQAQPVLWLSKGFEAGTGLLGHEIAAACRADLICGVLSGPSFAQEVANGQPTAVVAASSSAALAVAAVAAFHSEALRVYTSDDLIGVEVGGAVKNVLAIATGMADGMAEHAAPGVPGLNARAALITRGLAEMTRLGVALGARGETFMGLAGLGDLVLTATGELSRNRRVGLELARGKTLAQALAELGHVAEGVASAAMVVQRARSLDVEMPISEAVLAVLDGRLPPRAALTQLMARQPRAEHQLPPA